LDNFEWLSYVERFGVVAVDYTNGTLARHIKKSGYFLSEFFKDAKSPYGTAPKKLGSGTSNATVVATVTTGATGSVETGKKSAGLKGVSLNLGGGVSGVLAGLVCVLGVIVGGMM
jgi:hypothetical protein